MKQNSVRFPALIAVATVALLLLFSNPVSAQNKIFTSNTTISDNSYEGWDITVRGCTVTINGSHTFASLIVENNGIVTHSAATAPGLNLTITGNCRIDQGSAIKADGLGYPAAQGPGAGQSGTGDNRGVGGGYGGMGTYGNGNPFFGKCYGSITEPTDFGSGGGKGRSGTDLGGAGGGAIRLTVFGSLTVNGKITANGQGSSYGGGGSGGSIWITTQSLFGVGLIAANAEWAGYGGGAGGGGRIAVYYTIKSGFTNGIIECRGGERDDKVFGGAGTIYYQQAGTTIGDLVVDNSGNAGYGTQLLEKSIFANVVIKNGGSLEPPQLQTLDLTALGNITIQSNSKIHANGMGYPATQGPGAGQSGTGDNRGGGGGYGGAGGQGYNGIPGGPANGSAQYQQPTELGSGGGNGYSGTYTGGSGGGAIRLKVYGSLIVNGPIAADGAGAYRAGGGSGGSIWITTQSLSGPGLIRANGGNGADSGGGGGGGRIALYYTDKSGFTGVIQVNGGPGWKNGNAGTIHQAAVASVRLLSLSLNVNSLAGGQTGVGTVAISEAAPAPGVSIGLSSSNANALTVPSSVTIAEGQTIGTFIYTAKAVSAPTIATITASFGGVTQSAPVTVNPWMQSFSISPGSISGSGVVMGSITLYQAAPPTGLAVNLTCPDAGIQVPATVYVGPGKTTLNNIAITVGEIVTARSAVVTASFEAESRTFTLYLNPPGLQARSVSATPASTIGGNPATGVVILTAPAPAGGAMVALSCSDTSIATIPSFVLIGAGQMNGSFPIATKPVTTQQSAFIKASISNTVTTTLTVRLPGVSILSLVPDSVLGGEASMAIVTLEQKYNVPITVDVTSDKSQAAPTTPITIPAGQTIGVSVIETSAVTSTMTAAITATANGLSKTQNLTIQGDTSTTKYTMADVQRALSIACGFTAGLTSDMSRCNVVTTGQSALVIDLLDASAIARKVAELDPNP